MADFNDIYDYVTTTPGNTNRRVLKSLVDQLTGSGEGASGGIKVVDTLPETANEGDICLVPKNYLGEPKTIIETCLEGLNESFDIEDFYRYFADYYSLEYETLTDEQKIELKTQENLQRYLGKGPYDDSFIYNNVTAILNINAQNFNFSIADYFNENNYQEIDGRTVYESDTAITYYSQNGTEYLHQWVGVIGPLEILDEDRPLLVPYNDGFVDWFAPFLIASESNSIVLTPIVINVPLIEDDEDEFFVDKKEKYLYKSTDSENERENVAYFYIPNAGNYTLKDACWELFEEPCSFEATEAGWYVVYAEFVPGGKDKEYDMNVCKLDEKTIVPSIINLEEPFDDYIDYESINFSGNELIFDTTDLNKFGNVLNIYNYQNNGLFIYTNNKWKLISLEENKTKEMFQSVLQNGEEVFLVGCSDKEGQRSYPPIYYDSYNHSLEYSYYYFMDGRNYSLGTYTIDLSDLAQDLHIRKIAYQPAGDTKYQYCYRVYYNDDDSSDDSGDPPIDTHYFDFFVDKPADLTDYALRSELPNMSNYATTQDISNFITRNDLPEKRLIYFTTKSSTEYGNLVNSGMADNITSVLAAAYDMDSSFRYENYNFNGAKYIVVEQANSDYTSDDVIYHHSASKCDWIKIDYSDLEARITALEQANQ